MPKIICDGAIVDDNWVVWHTADDGTITLPTSQQAPQLIVPLKAWQAHRQDFVNRDGKLGLLLQTDDEPEQIAADVSLFSVIAIHFSKFTDGRGYSLARLLRERYGYRGELRAVGDVLRDQLFYMKRSGFNAFTIRADRDIHDALKSLRDLRGLSGRVGSTVAIV